MGPGGLKRKGHFCMLHEGFVRLYASVLYRRYKNSSRLVRKTDYNKVSEAGSLNIEKEGY
jgi:hypothetical protein